MSQSMRPERLVLAWRSIVWLFLLVVVLVSQSFYTQFVRYDSLIVLYSLFAVWALSQVALLTYEKIFSKNEQGLFAFFALDTILLAILGEAASWGSSILLLVFFVQITVVGLLLGKMWAYSQSLLTLVVFNLSLLLTANESGLQLFYLVVLNDLSFIGVGKLTGVLREHYTSLENIVSFQDKKVRFLENINDLIVENIGVGIVVCASDGRIQRYNGPAAQILGTIEEQNSLWDILPSLKHFFQSVQRQDSRRVEVNYDGHRGQAVLEVVISPIKEDGKIGNRSVVVFQDVTEVKRLQKSLQQAEKLAAVGQLAAGIAHEIRNPLASISGSVEMLKSTDNDEELQERLMNIVIREIDRLNRLVSEFLDFSRPTFRCEEEVDLKDLVIELQEILEADPMSRDVELVVELTDSAVIQGNGDKLKQALLNISRNALQAMETQTSQRRLRIHGYSDSSSHYLGISDTGPGISEDEQKRIFEPFHTTKSTGTGLGLAVTHKILDHHQALIFIESKLGAGTEFLIKFPKYSQQSTVSSKSQ